MIKVLFFGLVVDRLGKRDCFPPASDNISVQRANSFAAAVCGVVI